MIFKSATDKTRNNALGIRCRSILTKARCSLTMVKTINGITLALQLLALITVLVATAHAQTSPWETVATRLATAFTGAIAKGLALVAIVLGGLTLAFSEAGGKRAIGGLVFGCGLALGASNFMTWLFS